MTNKENKVRNIYRDMTIKYSEHFKDLKEGKIHPPLCNCWLCLWRKHIEQTKHKKGKKYDWLTFFIWDLIFEVRIAYLKEKGIAKRIKKNGKNGWEYPFGVLSKAPYIRKVKEILSQIPKLKEIDFFYLGLDKYIKYRFELDIKRKRFERSKFLKLLDKLESDIWWDWQMKQPDYPQKEKKWKQNRKALQFAQKVARFIYSEPNKQANQRDLLRHFNKKQKDLEAIWNILKWNYGIKIQDKTGYRKKQTFYRGTMKNSRGRYWKVGL